MDSRYNVYYLDSSKIKYKCEGPSLKHLVVGSLGMSEFDKRWFAGAVGRSMYSGGDCRETMYCCCCTKLNIMSHKGASPTTYILTLHPPKHTHPYCVGWHVLPDGSNIPCLAG
jgi:hypothetical protein